MDIKKEYERWLENATADTVCINGRDQSEMLGAFLWGKRAESQLISHSNAQGKIELTASHDGYSPAKHMIQLDWLFVMARLWHRSSGQKAVCPT